MCDLRYKPRLRPSASMMAIELKNTGPARSKRLIGSTTPSSRATSLKYRTARFSSTLHARFRWRLSCSMQKYGASNNSGRRMTWAPRAAASRTSLCAFAILPALSQSQDIWIAATVTWRGLRRKCSGSVDIDDLSGVEYAARIQGGFQDTHGRNLGTRARDFKISLSLETDTVLGRDGAAHAAQRLVHTLLHFVEGGRMPLGVSCADADVQIAIRDVSKHELFRARHALLQGTADDVEITRHIGNGETYIEAVRRSITIHLEHILARRPQTTALRLGFRYHRIHDQFAVRRIGQHSLEPLLVCSRIRSQSLDEHIHTVPVGKRRRAQRGRTRRELVELRPERFERAQLAAEASIQHPQQPGHCAKVAAGDKRGTRGGRAGSQAQIRTCHNPQGPLGADEQLFQIVPGIVFQHPVERAQHRSVRKH